MTLRVNPSKPLQSEIKSYVIQLQSLVIQLEVKGGIIGLELTYIVSDDYIVRLLCRLCDGHGRAVSFL